MRRWLSLFLLLLLPLQMSWAAVAEVHLDSRGDRGGHAVPAAAGPGVTGAEALAHARAHDHDHDHGHSHAAAAGTALDDASHGDHDDAPSACPDGSHCHCHVHGLGLFGPEAALPAPHAARGSLRTVTAPPAPPSGGRPERPQWVCLA